MVEKDSEISTLREKLEANPDDQSAIDELKNTYEAALAKKRNKKAALKSDLASKQAEIEALQEKLTAQAEENEDEVADMEEEHEMALVAAETEKAKLEETITEKDTLIADLQQ